MPWCATSTSKPRKHEVKRSMSIIEPKIDVLLDRTDNDRFLLCALASKRAHDINDMMRGQRDRAIQLQTAVEIARAADKKPLSLAFNEIARGEVSYDPNSIDIKNHKGSAVLRTAEPVDAAKPRSARSCRSKHSSRTEVRFGMLSRQSRAPRGFSLTYNANRRACFRALRELSDLLGWRPRPRGPFEPANPGDSHD